MPHSTPWIQGKQLTAAKVQSILQQNFPKLSIESVSALGDGWDNTTWLINNALVFRFPKHAEAAELLRNEIKTLPLLPILNVSHPQPELICLQPHGFNSYL